MSIEPHGLLLTGGTSRRMGTDKAMLELQGSTLASRAARALASAASPVLVVGPGSGTGLEAVDDPREGPLSAIVAGADALAARGCTGPVLAVACDLPFIRGDVLAAIVAALGTAGAAVPMLDGRDQPLAACYAPASLSVARSLVAHGKRAMHDLLSAVDVRRISEEEWSAIASAGALIDVDTPEQWDAARARAGRAR